MLVPHSVILAGLERSAYVRFSVLALSSIFFLVDPFAALPTFLAVTAGVDAQRRRKMAWKASVTAMVVLSLFAVVGQHIFDMFGIKLPAFEIAGGIILLLIGLDMLEAKRSPTQESTVEAAEADHFTRCPACGGVIDVRDLAIVLAHLRPLPHPAGDKPQ